MVKLTLVPGRAKHGDEFCHDRSPLYSSLLAKNVYVYVQSTEVHCVFWRTIAAT